MLTLVLVAMLAEASEPRSIQQMNLDELMSCAGDAPRCEALDWDLGRELARRHGIAELSARLQRETGAKRRVLAFALYSKPSNPDVAKLMKELSSDPDEEIAYYALNYRAKRCEQDALAKLVAPPYEARAACEQWATTVSLVGKCKYEPGGRFLVEYLDHACLNLVLAAEKGLRRLYPDAPSSFKSVEEEKAYFLKRTEPSKVTP